PPATSTTTPGSGVAMMSATRTRVSSPGARRKWSDFGLASPPGITVMVASTLVSARLATMTVSSARPSGVDVPSAQYHAVDAAPTGGTLTPSRTAAGAAAGPLVAAATVLSDTATPT